MKTLTLEEIQKIHGDKPFKRVVTYDEAVRQQDIKKQTAGNQFEEPKKTGVLGFLQRATDTVFGGGKLAEGLGQSLAAPTVQKQLSEAESVMSDTLLAITKQINKRKGEGADTARLEKARTTLMEDMGITRDAQDDFVKSLVTNKEVIGSSLRLATSAALPSIGGGTLSAGTGTLVRGGTLSGGIAGLTGARGAVGLLNGAARGALSGAITGGIGGASIGAGYGLEANKDASGIAKSALVGGVGGAVTGGVIGGAFGAVTGKMNYNKSQQNILDSVTPNTKDLTPTQYKKLLAQGRITPKTTSNPAQYVLSENEKATAIKFADTVTKDPVQTSINMNNKIASLDDDVGAFLKKNNGTFNNGELKNHISSFIADIDDITVDEARLTATKQRMVDNFVDGLKKNDQVSLWSARKEFDQTIEKAFSGSPTLQNKLKVGFRNAVQDYIANRTPDTTYKGYMKDMSNLYNLRDTVMTKAVKERAQSTIGLWIKQNPLKASAVGLTLAGVGGYFLRGLVPGGDSSGG